MRITLILSLILVASCNDDDNDRVAGPQLEKPNMNR